MTNLKVAVLAAMLIGSAAPAFAAESYDVDLYHANANATQSVPDYYTARAQATTHRATQPVVRSQSLSEKAWTEKGSDAGD